MKRSIPQRSIRDPLRPGDRLSFAKRVPDENDPRSAIPTYFQRPCPTCGRRLLIPVQYLGRQVSCSHCRGRLIAYEVSQGLAGDRESVAARAERLLAVLASPGAIACATFSQTVQPRLFTLTTRERNDGIGRAPEGPSELG